MEQTRAARSIRFPALSLRSSLQPSAATWVLLQQAFGRGLVAVKFIALGRILGMAAIGTISVALLAIAIAEALSDTGLAQAIVQGREAPTRSQLSAVLTTLMTRGVLMALALAALAPVMYRLFHLGPGQLALLQFAAVVPLLRGLMSPAYFIVQRERHFQHIAAVETAGSVTDCAVAIGAALAGASVFAALIGTVAADSLKCLLTWVTMRPRPVLRLSWAGIGHYVRFSRWIWAGSVVTLLLNQFDKFVVGALLGPTQFGVYQMSSRFAQVLLVDAAMAMSQFLFPTFASHHRRDAYKATRLFNRFLVMLACGLAALVLFLRAIGEWLFMLVLGKSWIAAIPIFDILVINMAISALIVTLVAYLRAIGDARAATHATMLQATVLAMAVPLATRHWGVFGVAWSMTAGLTAAASFMLYRLKKRR